MATAIFKLNRKEEVCGQINLHLENNDHNFFRTLENLIVTFFNGGTHLKFAICNFPEI